MMPTMILFIIRKKLLNYFTQRMDRMFMDGEREVLLMVLVYWVMISRKLVTIRFFIRISQLMLYIFTH